MAQHVACRITDPQKYSNNTQVFSSLSFVSLKPYGLKTRVAESEVNYPTPSPTPTFPKFPNPDSDLPQISDSALPAKMCTFNSLMQQNACYRNIKRNFEDLLPWYCYALKTNSRTIRS